MAFFRIAIFENAAVSTGMGLGLLSASILGGELWWKP